MSIDTSTSLTRSESRFLYKYASRCKFIIETGAGDSTKCLAKAALRCKAQMISIEIDKNRCKPIKGVEYLIGWSVSYNDIIKKGSSSFIDLFRSVKYKCVDKSVAHGEKKIMKGKKDLIRKALKKYKNLQLDFFFCDSGEYCGLAEWNIVKNKIKVGGYFAAHDVYYPKSIKSFKIFQEIMENRKWKIIILTKSYAGLFVARKIK